MTSYLLKEMVGARVFTSRDNLFPLFIDFVTYSA